MDVSECFCLDEKVLQIKAQSLRWCLLLVGLQAIQARDSSGQAANPPVDWL